MPDPSRDGVSLVARGARGVCLDNVDTASSNRDNAWLRFVRGLTRGPIAPMDLNELLVFARVVEAGSFTQGALRLAMPKSTVSLQIARLEARLGVRLLHRTTRQLRLTEEGSALYERCRRIMEEVEEAERSVAQEGGRPRGHLRITAPIELGTAFLGNWAAEYRSSFPEVSIELDLSSRIVDIVGENYDLAIRAGHLATSSNIARLLGTLSHHLYASPEYLGVRGTPSEPGDLVGQVCLGHRSQVAAGGWMLTDGVRIEAVKPDFPIVANSFAVLRNAVAEGAGVALIPDYLCRSAEQSGRLARVLPAWSVAVTEIFAVYPTRRHLATRVRSFLDFIAAKLDAEASADV